MRPYVNHTVNFPDKEPFNQITSREAFSQPTPDAFEVPTVPKKRDGKISAYPAKGDYSHSPTIALLKNMAQGNHYVQEPDIEHTEPSRGEVPPQWRDDLLKEYPQKSKMLERVFKLTGLLKHLDLQGEDIEGAQVFLNTLMSDDGAHRISAIKSLPFTRSFSKAEEKEVLALLPACVGVLREIRNPKLALKFSELLLACMRTHQVRRLKNVLVGMGYDSVSMSTPDNKHIFPIEGGW